VRTKKHPHNCTYLLFGNVTGWIDVHNRIIVTIRIHIVSNQSCPRTDIRVRIEESTPLGIIVAGIEVVKTSFRIEVIAAVAEGVYCRCGSAACGDFSPLDQVPPGIVGIGVNFNTVFVVNSNDVALGVGGIEIGLVGHDRTISADLYDIILSEVERISGKSVRVASLAQNDTFGVGQRNMCRRTIC